MNMTNDQKILEAMEIYGGGFASALSVAAQRADQSNFTRLKKAFPDLWKHHSMLAEQLERNRAYDKLLAATIVQAEETRGSEEDSQ